MKSVEFNHSIVHANAILWFVQNRSDLRYAINLDLQVADAHGTSHVRPDICGLKGMQVKLAIEIAKTNPCKDPSVNLRIYEKFKILEYYVIDCKERKITSFHLEGNSYIPFETDPPLYDVFI